MSKNADKPVYKRSGSRFWHIRYSRPDGTTVRLSSKSEDFAEAEAQYKALKNGTGLLVDELATRFFAGHSMKPKTKLGYVSSYENWFPYVAHLRVEQVTRAHIQLFVADRLKKVKSGTIRNDLAFLSSLYTFASQLPNGPETNVVASFNKRHLKLPEKRVRWLRDDQVQTLEEKVANPVRWRIVLVGLEAGLRIGEILNLRVYQINLRDRYILLEGKGTKSGRARRVPMSEALCSTLAAQLTGKPNDLVFPNPATKKPYTSVKSWWPQAVKDAELGDFRFHDTRHHFASRYAQRGGRMEVLRTMLGHKTVTMTDRYTDLAEGTPRSSFGAWSGVKDNVIRTV